MCIRDRHSYSEQHYERIFLEGSDEQKNKVELDTEEGGAGGKRRQKRQREKRKQQEQEDGATEAPKAKGQAELSQLSTTKSHAPGQYLFSFDSESRSICPHFQKMIKLCAAEAEAHWALLCDGMWLLKGLRLLGLPFDASKEQQTEQRVMKQQHNAIGSLQQAMEAAAEKKIREEKNVNKVEKTKDKELEELRAENAKLKSGELSSLCFFSAAASIACCSEPSALCLCFIPRCSVCCSFEGSKGRPRSRKPFRIHIPSHRRAQ